VEGQPVRAATSFRASGSLEHHSVCAEVVTAGLGYSSVEVTVQDRRSGATLRLTRGQLMPLLKLIRESVKSVEDAAAGFPSDPVERASLRVPMSGKYHGWKRAIILKSYAKELDELRERYLLRFDEWTDRINNPPPNTPPPPRAPEGGWDPNS
jgi:hypothetical protein